MDNNILKEIWDTRIHKVLCYLKPHVDSAVLADFKNPYKQSARFYFYTPRKFIIDHPTKFLIDPRSIDISANVSINIYFDFIEKYLPENSLLAYGVYITGDTAAIHLGEESLLAPKDSPHLNSISLAKAMIESKRIWNLA